MINTGGFDVGVMPTYSPVNPSLASFNPVDITHGLMDSIQLTGNVDQLKAFRQHAAEIAATEGVRTQLLKAQADQAAIARDHAAAVQQASIDSAVAQFKANAAVQPKVAEQTVKTIDSNMPNIATKGLLEGTLLNNQLGSAKFEGTRQPILQGVQRQMDQAAVAAAPWQADTIVSSAYTNKINADTAAKMAEEDFAKGKTGKAQLEDAQIQQYIANAAYLGSEAHWREAEAAKALAAAGHTDPVKMVAALDANIARLGKLSAGSGENSPATGKPETLDEYEQRVKDEAGATNTKRVFPYIGDSNKVAVPTSAVAERLLAQKRTLTAAKDKWLSQIAQGGLQQSSVDAGASLTDGAEVDPNKIYTPQEAALLPSGTVFLGTDGQHHTRK